MSSDPFDSQAPLADGEATRRSPRHPPPPPRPPSTASPPDKQKTVVAKMLPEGSPTPLKPLASRELGELLEGWELGHYRLEEFVGGGGMGAVFRATDLQLQRPVAVKVISGRHTDPEAIQRFKIEAQSAARLDHQNIARVYYVGKDKGWHYIVFEYIDGVNLRDLVAHKGPLPQAEAAGYALQVAAALDHAASRDVVHRDIKPSNVLVLADGSVKVVDMGLARLHQVESAHDLTESGVTLGSFDYISPEQAKDPRNADVRSDLYSLGCTMYHMLTGQPPFPAGTALQKLLRHSSDRPLDPRKLRPDLDSDLVGIVHKLLAKLPQQRYQHPRELISALLRVAPRLGLRTDGGGVAYVTAGPTGLERHLPWTLPTAGLFLVVVIMATLDRGTEIPFRLPPGPAPRALAASEMSDAPIGRDRTTEAAAPANGAQQPTAAAPEIPEQAPTPKPTKAPPGEALDSASHPAAPTDAGLPAQAPASLPASDAPASGVPAKEESRQPAPGESDDARKEPSPPALVAGPLTDDRPAIPPSDASGASRTKLSPAPEPLAVTDDQTGAVKLLVVGVAPLAPRPDARYFASVDEAFRMLESFPNVGTIELAVNGPFLVQPNIRLMLRSNTLNVRAAAGYTPVLVFQPQFPAWTGGRNMITVGRGKLVLDRLHFVFHLPATPADRWSLFRLQRDGELELNSCSLTLDHSAGLEESLQEAAFIEVSDGVGKGMMAESIASRPPLALRVTRCVWRGEADLIRCPQAESLTAVFRQCLLITSRHALVAGVSTMQEDWITSLRLEIQQSTLIARQGLAQWSLAGLSANAADLMFSVRNSIVSTDESAPLLEHIGPFAQERLLGQGLRFRDEENVYPSSQIRLRISGENRRPIQDVLFSRRNEPWYEGIGVSAYLKWRKPPPLDLPAHLQQASDYAVEEHGGGENTPGVPADALPLVPNAPSLSGPANQP